MLLKLQGLVSRWGDARSPAYGTLSDYQFMRRHSTSTKRQEKARQQWGESLSSVNDIISVFVKYTSGALKRQSKFFWLPEHTIEMDPEIISRCHFEASSLVTLTFRYDIDSVFPKCCYSIDWKCDWLRNHRHVALEWDGGPSTRDPVNKAGAHWHESGWVSDHQLTATSEWSALNWSQLWMGR